MAFFKRELSPVERFESAHFAKQDERRKLAARLDLAEKLLREQRATAEKLAVSGANAAKLERAEAKMREVEERARTLLREAAEAGQPASMFHLGEVYRLGQGVPPSATLAETWLRRAVVRGHVKALLSLVRLFDSGPEPDPNTAAILCRDAAELGDAEAQ